MFGSLFYDVLMVAIPALVLAFFGVALFLYCNARFRNKKAPGMYTEKQMWVRTALLIISSILLGAFLLVVIGIVVLFTTAIAFM